MTFEDRVRALEPFGFTERQTRFLVTAALHSGYCLRRQYLRFAGVRYGKNVIDFLESLVERELAARLTFRADRGHVYHLHTRSIYRAIGQEDNRNRRVASAALIARKVMLLDYVLGHDEVEWIATEQDKVDAFADRFRVPTADLPQRVFSAASVGRAATTRYFVDKLPIAIAGDPPDASFLYLVTDHSGRDFGRFLMDHSRLFDALPAWTVIVFGPAASPGRTACDAVFARHMQGTKCSESASHADLRDYFAMRRTVDRGDLSRLSVADIDRFRQWRERFSAPAFETRYAAWLTQGDRVLEALAPAATPRRPRRAGRLVHEVFAFDYSQFGSLPGVA